MAVKGTSPAGSTLLRRKTEDYKASDSMEEELLCSEVLTHGGSAWEEPWAGDFEPCPGYLSEPRDVTRDIIQKHMTC